MRKKKQYKEKSPGREIVILEKAASFPRMVCKLARTGSKAPRFVDLRFVLVLPEMPSRKAARALCRKQAERRKRRSCGVPETETGKVETETDGKRGREANRGKITRARLDAKYMRGMGKGC